MKKMSDIATVVLGALMVGIVVYASALTILQYYNVA
jgi:hypothetical protein